jgi:hypothetical protein
MSMIDCFSEYDDSCNGLKGDLLYKPEELLVEIKNFKQYGRFVDCIFDWAKKRNEDIGFRRTDILILGNCTTYELAIVDLRRFDWSSMDQNATKLKTSLRKLKENGGKVLTIMKPADKESWKELHKFAFLSLKSQFELEKNSCEKLAKMLAKACSHINIMYEDNVMDFPVYNLPTNNIRDEDVSLVLSVINNADEFLTNREIATKALGKPNDKDIIRFREVLNCLIQEGAVITNGIEKNGKKYKLLNDVNIDAVKEEMLLYTV